MFLEFHSEKGNIHDALCILMTTYHAPSLFCSVPVKFHKCKLQIIPHTITFEPYLEVFKVLDTEFRLYTFGTN
jgi:hypothetical protein